MKRKLAILSCLLVLAACSTLAQEVSEFLSMTVTPSLQETGNIDRLIITISNTATTAVTLGRDGDDYRIVLIDDEGGVFLPKRYPTASQVSRKPSGSTYAQVLPAQGSTTYFLSLRQEVRQDIPPGRYWLMVVFKCRSWAESVLTAPVVRITVGQKREL